jgi:hypothetical protein
MAKNNDETPQAETPKAKEVTVRLTAPHGFYDEDGNLRFWHAGHKVSGDDARLLIDRGAPVEELP